MNDKTKSSAAAQGRSLRLPAILTLALCSIATGALTADAQNKSAVAPNDQKQNFKTSSVPDEKYGKGGTHETISDENLKIVVEAWKGSDRKVRERHYINYDGDVIKSESWAFYKSGSKVSAGVFEYDPPRKLFKSPHDAISAERKEVVKWIEEIEEQFAIDGTFAKPYDRGRVPTLGRVPTFTPKEAFKQPEKSEDAKPESKPKKEETAKPKPSPLPTPKLSPSSTSKPKPPVKTEGEFADLNGRWNGWGGVEITGKNGTYEGTYNDTFSGHPGRFEFKKTGTFTFAGTWGESASRHGTFTLTVSEDRKTLWVRWKASVSNMESENTWTRVTKNPS